MMHQLTVRGGLRTQTFEPLLRDTCQRLRGHEASSGDVIVDLTGCSFIEAPSAAMLCALAYHLAGGNSDVTCLPPTRTDVRHYFEICGLAHALSKGAVGATAGHMAASGDFVLPVCKVSEERDVAAIGDFVYRSVNQRLGASSGFAGRSRSILDALCENVVVHAEAGTGGWAAAQVHRTEDGRQFLRIGVVDVGVGIPVTMARSHPQFRAPTPATHCDAIVAATEPGVSGRAGGGGIGLAQVAQLVADCKGTLHIRSLSGNVTIGIYGVDSNPVEYFPGTQLHIVLFG